MGNIPDQVILQFITSATQQLQRMAEALEALAGEADSKAPNYQRPIEDFAGFDWESIGATPIQADEDGPSHVEYKGAIYTRRSPSNKYKPAIWYSRPAGRDDEGNTQYERLITFAEMTEADPLPKALQGAKQPQQGKAKQQPAPIAQPADGAAGDQPQPGQYDAVRPKAANDFTTYWAKTVPAFGIDKANAQSILAGCSNNALQAFDQLLLTKKEA